MKDEYLDEYGKVILRRLNRQGILPSPYNFASYNPPSTDEYIVHDSTLREGEQTPGVIFTIEDKLRIAKNELGMNLSNDIAEKVLSRIKRSFSQEGRRSAYTPSELKELITEIQGVEVRGINNNREDSGKLVSQQ